MATGSLITGVSSGPSGTQSFRHLEQSGRILQQGTPGTSEAQKAQGESEFMSLVSDFIGDVNHMQQRSGNALKAFVAGEITDLHQVMVAGKEAGVALDLMIEIRNRVQESFQEIMPIQV